MNPINQKRLSTFKSNKRAWFSWWIFLVLFILSLGAEFIANEHPLFVSYKGQWYWPIFKSYPETTFGGDFDTETDYNDPFIIDLINENGYIVRAPIPYSFDTHILDLNEPTPSPPTQKNWLGTDDQARDVSARIIYGFRISVLFALALTFGSSIIGVAVGAIQGYFSGLTDLIGQRFLEIWTNLPVLYLLIILSSIVTPSIWWLLLILLLFSWTALVDVVRAETLKTRKQDYVTAARALGLTDNQILLRHILPNATVAALTFLPFIMTGAITTLTSLDFLGFGLPPGSASLGELLAQGKANVHAPWLGLSGFFSIAILLTLLVFIGEGIRDAFDPRGQ
ncbi:Inner membrane ABC transporter permease protein YejE [BD1-7 clade bacterium]|uniref:Inner membrane ABC transporter permease protein YejE n=1 Tax=BD1-7 clade bacterium TaxID=2029982 RepID=A0A5S9QSF9_9GAMM|nr:Inner membrane ABC transporter permease protein YejE [BD1-7 clade bacterium]CAA0122514.1 Inner membrane ABC transporter permease protein YejE [BD1-7 clade bacterium]